VKFKLQLTPAPNVVGQFVTLANGDVTLPNVSVTDAFVEFVITVPYVGDVVPTVTSPKLWPAVVIVTLPLGATVPVSVPPFDGPNVVPPAVPVIDHVAVCVPLSPATGAYVNTISQPATGMLVPQLFCCVNGFGLADVLITTAVNGIAAAVVFVTCTPYVVLLPINTDPMLCVTELNTMSGVDAVTVNVVPVLVALV
jgi:hypothetical protein